METNIELLAKLGCSTAEAETFLVLFAHSEGLSVVELQKKRGLPRPTLYDHLAKLAARNLVRRGHSRSGARFWAGSAVDVANVFSERADELELARVAIVRTLPKVSGSTRRKSEALYFRRRTCGGGGLARHHTFAREAHVLILTHKDYAPGNTGNTVRTIPSRPHRVRHVLAHLVAARSKSRPQEISAIIGKHGYSARDTHPSGASARVPCLHDLR